jgi:hypothetical protein
MKNTLVSTKEICKKILCVFCAFSWLFFVANCAFGYSGGTGEPNNPYQIANVADLLELGADEPNYDKSFILTADINLAGYDFNTAVIAPRNIAFTGVFNGACHKIKNLIIYTDTYTQYLMVVGLFGTNSGQLNNLNLDNVVITSMNINAHVGSLIGNNYFGIITNCHVTDIDILDFNSYDGEAGGLLGFNENGHIVNCSSDGIVRVSSPSYSYIYFPASGGLVGHNFDGEIVNCYSSCDIISDYYTGGAGGLAGSNSGDINGVIINCYSTGTVRVYNSHIWPQPGVGGLVGVNNYAINKCFSTSPVIINGSYSRDAGGLVGRSFGTIRDCFSTGPVTISVSDNGIDGLGGFTGYNFGEITNCYSIGAVNSGGGIGNIGGFVGDVDSGSIINSSYFLDTSGPHNGYGMPLPDSEMKQQSSFVGWDFVGETINGTEDIWCIFDSYTYPKLAWYWCEPNSPDVVCPGEGGPGGGNGKSPNYDDKGIVNFIDYAIFAAAWLTENPLVSLDTDTDVDIYDLKLFCNAWLEELQ